MNTCKSMRQMMLTAIPQVLHGAADDPLARHISMCPACARLARQLLSQTEYLDQALDAGAPPLDVDAVLARAAAAEPDGPVPSAAEPRTMHARRRWMRWAPLAIAASLAALLLVVRTESPGPPTSVSSERSGVLPSQSHAFPTVQSAPGRNVAVIPTDNPDITVVWYF